MGLENADRPIGHINLEMKLTGKRSARNSPAAFDVAGAGNGLVQSTAPVPDPTDERGEETEQVHILSPRLTSTLPVRALGR